MGNLQGSDFQRLENLPNNLNTGLTQFYPAITFNERVVADGGAINDKNQLVELYNNYLNQLPETVFLFNPEVSTKERTSGIYKYINKVYDLGSSNYDAVQTTDATQPFLGGFIAPNEKRGIKYVIDQTQSGLLDFTDKVFTSGDTWTLTSVLKINKKGAGNTLILFGTSASLQFYNNIIYLCTTAGAVIMSINYNLECGKTYIIECQYTNGVGLIKVNGISYTTTVTPGAITFGQIYNMIAYPFDGTLYHIHLTNTRKTEYQSQVDTTILRNLYPEIEGIGIGNQYWSSSNFEGVVDGAGNIINEVTGNTTSGNTELVTNGNFAVDPTTYWTLVNATAVWNSGTTDYTITSVATSGNVGINKGLVTIGKMYKLTFRAKSSASLSVASIGDNTNVKYSIKNPVATTAYQDYEFYFRPTSGLFRLYFYSNNSGQTVTLDDISLKEVGWDSSTTIYNVVSGATTGNTTTATIESSMWRYGNTNDPVFGNIYGKLYNGYSTWLIRQNPPKGWKVPTYTDRDILTTYIGGGNWNCQ